MERKASHKLKENERKRYEIMKELAIAEKANSIITFMNEYLHDLKSPWYVLRTYLKFEDNKDKVDPEFRKIFEDKYNYSQEIITVMNKILKGERQRMERPLNLNLVIESVLKLFQVRVWRIEKDYQQNLPLIKGDLQDLQIMFSNLFKNAIEALSKVFKNRMIIKTASENDKVIVTISDTGGGLEDKILEDIWNPNKKNGIKTHNSEIGLITVKRVIDEHKAEIDVFVSKGIGTTFTLTFPIAAAI
ncbi:sensor histidine kinase [Candidatus Margulisiibacteriota bacterium]